MAKVPPHMRRQAERVGEMLRRFRSTRTLAQLAELSGFSKSTLHRWEQDGTELPSPEQAARLDEVLQTGRALQDACVQAIARSAFGFPRDVGFTVFPTAHEGEVHLLLQAPPEQSYDTLEVMFELGEAWSYRTQLAGLDHIGQAFLTAKPAPGDCVVLVRTSKKVIMTGAVGFPELEDSERIHILVPSDWTPLPSRTGP